MSNPNTVEDMARAAKEALKTGRRLALMLLISPTMTEAQIADLLRSALALKGVTGVGLGSREGPTRVTMEGDR